jgi:hypothetical protein
MNRILFAVILVLSCGAANAEKICPYDTLSCRLMPERYIAPQVPQLAPDGSYHIPPSYSDQPTYGYPQRYLAPRAPQIAPDGSYPADDD